MKKWCFEIIIFVCLLTGIMLFKNKISGNNLVGVYVDNIESSILPDKDNHVIDKVVCDNEAVGTWDNANWNLLITNLSKKSNCKLYFRSKKEITVTYDNNFVKNNIFEEIYNTNQFVACCESGAGNQYIKTEKISQNGDIIYYVERLPRSTTFPDWGYYFTTNGDNLTLEKKYYFQFYAKGNESFSATIGSELNGTNSFQITNTWQKYSHKFIARRINYGAFIFYYWPSSTDNRTLQIKNIEMQEGEYDNFSTINLKEYDTLNNTLPTPTRDNYTFLGWYTDPIDGDKVDNNTVVSKDTTYYARWQYNG